MGLWEVDGPAGKIRVPIAGKEPTPDEINNKIIPAYKAHTEQYVSSKGTVPPSMTMTPAQAGIAASGFGSPGLAGAVLGDPLASAQRPEPATSTDVVGQALYNMERRNRAQIATGRAENLLEGGASAAAGMIPGAILPKTVGTLAQAGALRRGANFIGRLGVNVGSGVVGSASVDAYRGYINSKVDSGELPKEFARPDFKYEDYRNNVLMDLAIGGGLETTISGFRAARNKILSLPKNDEMRGAVTAANDMGIELGVGDVTKNRLLAGWSRTMNSIPVVRSFVGKSRKVREAQVISAYGDIFSNPFAPRTSFTSLGVDLEKGVRKDAAIFYGNIDKKLNGARMDAEARGVTWDSNPIVDVVDRSIQRRSDLAIPTTFERRGESTVAQRKISATETTPTYSKSQGFTEDIAAGTGPVPFDRQRVSTGTRGSVSESKVQTERVVTMRGSVPEFSGEATVDEWMLALSGIDTSKPLSLNELLEIRNGVTRAYQKGDLSHSQTEFLHDLDHTLDSMIENSPDPQIRDAVRDAYADMAAFRSFASRPAGSLPTKLDKNILSRNSNVVPGGMYSDELFNHVVDQIDSGAHGVNYMNDLHSWLGTGGMKEATDSYLARVGSRHFHKDTNGQINFDWDGLRRDLGLSEGPSLKREGLDRALKLSGSAQSSKQLGEQIDILEKTMGKKWTDPGDMASRRFTLGGVSALHGMLASGLVTGATLGGGPAAGLASAAALGLLGRYLNNPAKLKSIIELSSRSATDAGFLNAQRQLVEMYAKDLILQHSGDRNPSEADLEEARKLVAKHGGLAPPIPPLFEAPIVPGMSTPHPSRIGSVAMDKLNAMREYLQGPTK